MTAFSHGPTVRVWADVREAGRCKYCRRRIVWLTTDDGHAWPFDLGFTVREEHRHPTTQVRLSLVARSDLHDCPEKREARRGRSRPRAARLF